MDRLGALGAEATRAGAAFLLTHRAGEGSFGWDVASEPFKAARRGHSWPSVVLHRLRDQHYSNYFDGIVPGFPQLAKLALQMAPRRRTAACRGKSIPVEPNTGT